MSARAKKRRPQAERRRESMALILDCAEAEFAEKGFNGTTLASVAEVAGVDTALMRYYFGDKEALFESVFRRRAPASNNLRRRAMAAYRASAGEAMTLEGIIDAFIRPAFELMANDQGWRNYASIVAYVSGSRGELRRLMSEAFDAVSHELIADMRKIIPGAREEDLYWAYHFITSAYTFSLGQTGRIDVLSKGKVSSHDLAGVARRLPVVIAAGIRAMIDTGAKIQKRPFHPMAKNALGDEIEADWLLQHPD